MKVLTLLLAGPLQAWGAASRFTRRTTEHAPTKSGVLGLLAAAQGRERTDDLSDLAALRFGVRVDQRGTRIRDFQTAIHLDTGKSMPVSERFYLADAVFVAAVEGEDTLIDTLHQAVQHPVYLPYLGRRSCPPSRPINLGVHSGKPLEQVLAEEKWHAANWYQRQLRDLPEVPLDLLVDAPPGDPGADSLRDLPISFDPVHRRYALRGVRTLTVTVPNPQARKTTPPNHDPTPLLGEPHVPHPLSP
ncbi:type I-E CRISPR-associated protein Cas5/CasD [Thermobifida fusca]|uniref:CRISPR-associated Cas5e family protein n=1 Tax=Thermobifida fusca TM51 TaxID=1169414 RepID=A0A9P2WQA3_THEFU|nr:MULTISPECIES: type I-E CRISPR-associated protein Cas5/CasD [Thermobifida]EOR71312.1 CRISPR-associated Cas5e family protein [Thermobifida fusca TM51]MBO2531177.1 type I-E CRISPR-associated protein Cas5/CasD [Thermobifida sp.]PPS91691.1 CRISPR-associated protein Cas5 [Thermobifida fusca]PZN60754.1 MAG: type I-E CRISPR-associated protein Cas5/CasD [Thermobifida fusca]QOS58178.1 type I-E CRISPR-associated protein Cas5/CasD [Thermobifida fusca]